MEEIEALKRASNDKKLEVENLKLELADLNKILKEKVDKLNGDLESKESTLNKANQVTFPILWNIKWPKKYMMFIF